MPPESSVGFAPADWLLLLLTGLFLLASLTGRPSVERAFAALPAADGSPPFTFAATSGSHAGNS
jgi:hypothetical protein